MKGSPDASGPLSCLSSRSSRVSSLLQGLVEGAVLGPYMLGVGGWGVGVGGWGGAGH